VELQKKRLRWDVVKRIIKKTLWHTRLPTGGSCQEVYHTNWSGFDDHDGVHLDTGTRACVFHRCLFFDVVGYKVSCTALFNLLVGVPRTL
jgi:hypothetical protein